MTGILAALLLLSLPGIPADFAPHPAVLDAASTEAPASSACGYSPGTQGFDCVGECTWEYQMCMSYCSPPDPPPYACWGQCSNELRLCLLACAKNP